MLQGEGIRGTRLCASANRRNSKGYRKAVSSLDFAKEGTAVRHVFPGCGAAVYKSRCQFPPIERFHWTLCTGAAGQYRRATIYPISNHREFPLAHANYRPICLTPAPFLSPYVHSSPKVHSNQPSVIEPSSVPEIHTRD